MKRSRSPSPNNYNKKFKPTKYGHDTLKTFSLAASNQLRLNNTVSFLNQQPLNIMYPANNLINAKKKSKDAQISVLQYNKIWSPD